MTASSSSCSILFVVVQYPSMHTILATPLPTFEKKYLEVHENGVLERPRDVVRDEISALSMSQNL